jgi:fructose-1,6-bisphosphatase
LAAKLIWRELNKAGLVNILGTTERTNFRGYILKNWTFLLMRRCIKPCTAAAALCAMALEENMSSLVEQAGGKASDGNQRILDVIPTFLRPQVPVIIDSTDDVTLCEGFFQIADKKQVSMLLQPHMPS